MVEKERLTIQVPFPRNAASLVKVCDREVIQGNQSLLGRSSWAVHLDQDWTLPAVVSGQVCLECQGNLYLRMKAYVKWKGSPTAT